MSRQEARDPFAKRRTTMSRQEFGKMDVPEGDVEHGKYVLIALAEVKPVLIKNVML